MNEESETKKAVYGLQGPAGSSVKPYRAGGDLGPDRRALEERRREREMKRRPRHRQERSREDRERALRDMEETAKARDSRLGQR